MLHPADFPTLPSESLFESLSCRPPCFRGEYGCCYQSYSGSYGLLRIRPQDAEGSEAIGLPRREGRAEVATAIPDYSITSMSASTQERSK
jgi:hypothetical protein